MPVKKIVVGKMIAVGMASGLVEKIPSQGGWCHLAWHPCYMNNSAQGIRGDPNDCHKIKAREQSLHCR